MSASRRLRRRLTRAVLHIASLAPEDAASVRAAWGLGRPIQVPDEQLLLAVLQALGGVPAHVVVLHGPSCSPIACRCSPAYRLEPLTPGNVRAGADSQERWSRESLS